MTRLPVNSRPSHFVEEEAGVRFKEQRLPSHFVEEEASVKFKQQRLLEDYLKVQKEFVARKKKLQTAKQKREILLAEVSFLRRRRTYLKMQYQELDAYQSIVGLQNSSAQSKLLSKNGNSGISRAFLKNPSSVLASNPILGEEEWNRERKEEIILNTLRGEKKRMNHMITEKKVVKKKISWQDQMALKPWKPKEIHGGCDVLKRHGVASQQWCCVIDKVVIICNLSEQLRVNEVCRVEPATA